MAPFPDEVDVFTGPHWRMKQLVGLYCDKVDFISLQPACKQSPNLIILVNPSCYDSLDSGASRVSNALAEFVEFIIAKLCPGFKSGINIVPHS